MNIPIGKKKIFGMPMGMEKKINFQRQTQRFNKAKLKLNNIFVK